MGGVVGYEAREAKIVVAYGDEAFEVAIKQSVDCIAYESREFEGTCNGTKSSDNYNYELKFKGLYEGETEVAGLSFLLDIYSVEGEIDDEGNVAVAPGTYTLDKDNTMGQWTICYKYSQLTVVSTASKEKFDEATLVVAESGALLTAVVNGQKYRVEYKDQLKLAAPRPDGSTLVSDIECDLSDHSISSKNYGDYYGVGYQNWIFRLSPSAGSGEFVQFEIISGTSTTDFYGRYTVNSSKEAFTILPGNPYQLDYSSMYYFSLDGKYMSSYGVFADGWLEVTDNGDGTATVTFDVYDVAGYNVKGTWTGIMTAPEYKE